MTQSLVIARPANESAHKSSCDTDPAPTRRIGRVIRLAVSVLSAVAFAIFVATRRTAFAGSLGRLGHPRWPWIPIAIGLEAASMVTFAHMQRRLLGAGGHRIGRRPMVATTLAANALSVSVPVAGPELGTAFTFRRFKKQGADTRSPAGHCSLLASSRRSG
jgi:uncharacterized membrane protein YbhN (UPF0104 family)